MLGEFLFSYSTTFSLVFSSFVWGQKASFLLFGIFLVLFLFFSFFVLPSRFCALLLIIVGGFLLLVLFFFFLNYKENSLSHHLLNLRLELCPFLLLL